MNTCRFCKQWTGEMLKYSTRHHAHARCFMNHRSDAEILALPAWLIGRLPFLALQERGLLDQARAKVTLYEMRQLKADDAQVKGAVS